MTRYADERHMLEIAEAIEAENKTKTRKAFEKDSIIFAKSWLKKENNKDLSRYYRDLGLLIDFITDLPQA